MTVVNSGGRMPSPDDELRELLGAQPPQTVLALSAGDRRELVEIVRESRQRQNRALEDAFTAALRHVPFPVRGIVRKVLLG